MARNTKLTQYLQKKICEGLKRGHYLKTAAPLAGVSTRSAHSWLARGRDEEKRLESGKAANKGEAIYLNFLHATEEATSHAVDRALQTLESEISQSARAAQWYLSHRFSGSWDGNEEFEERIEALEEVLTKIEEENNGKKT